MMWNFLIWLQAEQRSWKVCLRCQDQIRDAWTQYGGGSGISLLICCVCCSLPLNHPQGNCIQMHYLPDSTSCTGRMKVKIDRIEVNASEIKFFYINVFVEFYVCVLL